MGASSDDALVPVKANGSWWINDLSLANVGHCLGVFEICLTPLLPNQPCSSSCERSEDLVHLRRHMQDFTCLQS